MKELQRGRPEAGEALASGQSPGTPGVPSLSGPGSLPATARPFPVSIRSARFLLLVLGIAAIGPVLAPAYRHGAWLALLGAATGAAAGLIVITPAAAGPLRRVEMWLRVAMTAPVATLVLLPALKSASGPPAWVFLACLTWITVLLISVAFDPAAVPSVAVGSVEVQLSPVDLAHAAAAHAVTSPGVLPPFCALFKRSVDIAVALLMLFLVLPVMVVAAVATVLDSPGSWLFAQIRLGAGGQPFKMLKIRTMAVGNDDSDHRALMSRLIQGEPIPQGLYGKVADDPRRTRVGKVLRRLSIDELPQLLNVLRGDMSVVGPRPPLPWEAELYDAHAWRRLAGKPGLTGLWQVEGRNNVPFGQMVELDLRYFEEWTPLLDFRILAKTPKAVLWAQHTE